LDLCAGSGCVGLAIARYADNARVILAELSESALRVCRQNIRRNKLGDRVSALQADAKLPPPGALWDFDVIACNPPYIPTTECETLDNSVKNFEPRMALDGGADGLDFYRAIAKNWKSALRLGGTLLFEVGYGQAGDVELILAKNGYENIKTHQDTGEIWRVVEATANT
ncbi:MAG: HemK family protein methyltransferase, partial [Oscillospiraceae bacterium]